MAKRKRYIKNFAELARAALPDEARAKPLEIWFQMRRAWVNRELWQFLCQNTLANRVFDSYEAIVDVCCDAWNTLLAIPERVASITSRDWAQVSG
jgi:hypothetical protein